MVYSSDFYTSRRPAYYKPASSYSVTPLYSSDGYDIPPTYYKAHQVYQTSTTPTPFILTPPISTAKPSPNVLPYNGYSYHHQYLPLHRRSAATIHGVLDRIEHRPRSHPSYDPTDEYLNSRSSTNFDDVTRDIRAQTAGLLKQVYTPTIRLKMSSVSNGYTELPIAQRIESDAYIEKILSDSDSYRREHNIGKGHLACVSYAGGKAYPRRRPHLSKEVDDNITMLSYYNKTREAAIASSTHPSVKINGTEKRVFNNIEPLERREYKSQLNNYSTQRTPTKTVTTENETSETVQLAAAKKSAEKETARLAAEEEAAKLAAEEEAARLAAEEEEARLAAEEEEARRAAEKEAARLAAEEEVAKLAAEEEAARLAAEEEEARRVAEEEEARRVAEEEEARLAAEEEAARLAAEEEAARLAAEEEEARLAAEEEEARLAAKEKEARLAAEEEEARLAAEEEEARKAAEEKAAKLAAEEEEARTAAEEETRLELEQKAQEDEITTETEKSEQNINSIEKIIYDEDTDSLGNKISSAIASTTTTSTEIINEEDGEIKTSAIFQRTIKKTTTITTSTSVTSENDDVNTSVEIQEIIDEDNEGSSEDEHDTEQDAAQAEGQESSEEEDESEEESKEE